MIKLSPKRFSVLVLVYLIVLASLSYTIMTKAERPNYVYDWEGILTDEEILEINTLCRDIDTNTTVEVVIITLISYDEPLKVADIDEARIKYFNEYTLDGTTGIGKEGKDNGVLIILSTTMADYGIEVGYGLEGDLTDAECGRIGRDIINKYYKDEDYFLMFYGAVEAIGEKIGYGEPDISLESAASSDGQDYTIMFYGIVIVGGGVLIFLSLFYQDMKRRKREKERQKEREERRARARRVIPRPPPKPVYRFVECPTCGTKRKAKQKKAKTRVIVENETIFSVLLLTLTCLVCGTIITDTRDKRRIETVTERQERRRRDREEEEEHANSRDK